MSFTETVRLMTDQAKAMVATSSKESLRDRSATPIPKELKKETTQTFPLREIIDRPGAFTRKQIEWIFEGTVGRIKANDPDQLLAQIREIPGEIEQVAVVESEAIPWNPESAQEVLQAFDAWLAAENSKLESATNKLRSRSEYFDQEPAYMDLLSRYRLKRSFGIIKLIQYLQRNCTSEAVKKTAIKNLLLRAAVFSCTDFDGQTNLIEDARGKDSYDRDPKITSFFEVAKIVTEISDAFIGTEDSQISFSDLVDFWKGVSKNIPQIESFQKEFRHIRKGLIGEYVAARLFRHVASRIFDQVSVRSSSAENDFFNGYDLVVNADGIEIKIDVKAVMTNQETAIGQIGHGNQRVEIASTMPQIENTFQEGSNGVVNSYDELINFMKVVSATSNLDFGEIPPSMFAHASQLGNNFILMRFPTAQISRLFENSSNSDPESGLQEFLEQDHSFVVDALESVYSLASR